MENSKTAVAGQCRERRMKPDGMTLRLNKMERRILHQSWKAGKSRGNDARLQAGPQLIGAGKPTRFTGRFPEFEKMFHP
jgi:hypothetical protein